MIHMKFQFVNDEYGDDPDAGVSSLNAELQVENYASFVSTMIHYLEELRPPMKTEQPK